MSAKCRNFLQNVEKVCKMQKWTPSRLKEKPSEIEQKALHQVSRFIWLEIQPLARLLS